MYEYVMQMIIYSIVSGYWDWCIGVFKFLLVCVCYSNVKFEIMDINRTLWPSG